jgi:hypothetical protein
MESLCITIFISSYQKCYVFLIISYVFSSTKLEKRARQILPGNEGDGGGGQDGEVAQTMYMHMNKCKNNLKKTANAGKDLGKGNFIHC